MSKNSLDCVVVIVDTKESAVAVDYLRDKLVVVAVGKERWLTNINTPYKLVLPDFKDKERVKVDIMRYISRQGLMPKMVMSFSELNVELSAELNAFYQGRGIKVSNAKICRDKALMRKKAESCGILIPEYVYFDEPCSFEEFTTRISSINFPLLAKPRKFWGGMGINILRCSTEVESFFKFHSDHVTDFVFEAYLENAEVYSVGGIWNGKGLIQSVLMKHTTPIIDVMNKNKTDVIVASTMPMVPIFKDLSIKILQTFLPDTITMFEIEFLRTKSSEKIYMCEIAARPPSAHLPTLYKEVTGVDPYMMYVKLLFGGKIDHFVTNVPMNKQAAVVMFVPSIGKLKNFTDLNDIKSDSIFLREQSCRVGDEFSERNYGHNIGSLCLKADDIQKLQVEISNIQKQFHYEMEEEKE